MKPKGGKKPAVPWHDLQADVLQHIACCLAERERFKLNLVCKSWREGLEGAPDVWAGVTVDPRKKASTSRRIRFNKHLPTPAALSAWFGRYGRHVRRLHLRHLDADAEGEGCVAAADVAHLLLSVAASLRQLCFHQCAVQALLGQHAAALSSLHRLTSLHFQLRQDERLVLDTPEAAFITTLTGLQDLAVASGGEGPGVLPASLAALPSLRSLQLARVGPHGGIYANVAAGHGGLFYGLEVASCLTGLTALERLAISNVALLEQEPAAAGGGHGGGGGDGDAGGGGGGGGEGHGQEEAQQQAAAGLAGGIRLPSALLCLPRLASLMMCDVGLGQLGLGLGLGLQQPAALLGAQVGLYPLPPGLSCLAGSLKELALLQHTCGQQELEVLAALTGLTSLSLTAKHRALATPLPDCLCCLTALQQLKISHGLTQVPPAITGLTRLTLLDLAHNSLHSLKPGPYLKRLVAVSLGGNAFSHFPPQLKVARHTAQEIQLFNNDSMTVTEKDLEQLLTFEQLRQLTIYGASEDKTTRRCLATLQKSMPWLMIDV